MNTDTFDVVESMNTKIDPNNVHTTLSKHMLVDGFDIVLDLENSFGSTLVDSKTNKKYLDFFTFFASSPLGMNHPRFNQESVKQELISAATNKPSNSDIYTIPMAEFVDTFAEVAKPSYMKYLFFIAGGALAVENGLKVAFDWKVKKNFKKGIKEEKGQQVIHFKQAFHGRSGYTMSLTNTDPNKIMHFPKFNWPRIDNPKVTFPIANNLDEIIAAEEKAIEQINKAIIDNPDDIAVIIIEPVQAEGGDNFFRKEFFVKLREIADKNDILLMFDEVQTGFGLSGKFWCHEHYVQPDIVSFGKKAQVCGIMVSDRIDDIEDHCFRKSSRINSTWGADLTDMVRSKHILQIIKEENLVNNSAVLGEYLLKRLKDMENHYSPLISNTRGLGLLCSFDFENSSIRDEFRNHCYENNLLILGCGEKTIRFRPALNITKDALDEGLTIIENVLFLMSNKK